MFPHTEATALMNTNEGLLVKARAQFERLLGWLEAAADDRQRLDQVERGLLRELLALGLTLLQAFVARLGTGDVGPTLERDSNCWRRLPEPRRRRYVSIFGELELRRHGYGTREGQKIQAVPLDEALGLPASDFSYVVQDWSQRLCVKGSFAEAAAELQQLLGLTTSVASLETLNRQVSDAADGFRQQQAPPAVADGALLVVSGDGKGVPMCAADQPEPTPAADDGVPRGKKRMAYVGAVYSVAPFVRTADDVLDEYRRRQRAADRPAPQGKRVWAEMTQVVAGETCDGRTTLFGEMADDVARRDPTGAAPRVAVMDDEAALWAAMRLFFGDACVGVLDLIHVLGYLWLAAHVFHPTGSAAAQAFVDERLRQLLEGRVGRVVGGLRQMLAKHALTGAKRRTLQTVITYLANNQAHMRYDVYLAAGYPIASGVIEGACRHVVQDRLEQTGMRWTRRGAQAMLHLRALYLNGDWDAFLEHRIQTEQQALYGIAI